MKLSIKKIFHLNGELFKKNNFDKDIDYMLSDFFFFIKKLSPLVIVMSF